MVLHVKHWSLYDKARNESVAEEESRNFMKDIYGMEVVMDIWKTESEIKSVKNQVSVR